NRSEPTPNAVVDRGDKALAKSAVALEKKIEIARQDVCVIRLRAFRRVNGDSAGEVAARLSNRGGGITQKTAVQLGRFGRAQRWSKACLNLTGARRFRHDGKRAHAVEFCPGHSWIENPMGRFHSPRAFSAFAAERVLITAILPSLELGPGMCCENFLERTR